MKHPITISEINLAHDNSSPLMKGSALKITNTSEDFVNNVKLIINSPLLNICEESVIRQRGSLSFDPCTQCLELGNLAPNESAYFQYKFLSPGSLSSLSQHFSITYNTPGNPETLEKKIADD